MTSVREPIDPDLDARSRRRASQWPVVLAVSVGGGVGAVARYGASVAWPTRADAFPWTTLTVNATGGAAIGVFLVLVTEVWAAHRLLRPFVSTGVLGGFTTFSTYAVDVQRLVDDGHAGMALIYLTATVVAALVAVWLAATATRMLVVRRRRR